MDAYVPATRENTLIIMAASGGFPFDGYKNEGYNTISAYKKITVVLRILREICFRLPLLPKKIWFNTEIKKFEPQYIYIRDSIITKKYLFWVKKLFPDAQVNFVYDNLIGNARHLMPDQIPSGIRIWTFDPADSKKYRIRLKKVTPYFHCYLKKGKEKKYDILFIGRDKGRGDLIRKLQAYLECNGIITKFLITADGKFSKKKEYYEKAVSYDQLTDWVAESKAVLNICMDGQEGVTMRDIECYFNQIKLVTTNEKIINASIYDKDNTFILTSDNWKDLVDFLNKPYVFTHSVTWDGYRIEDAINEVTN